MEEDECRPMVLHSSKAGSNPVSDIGFQKKEFVKGMKK